MNYLKLNADGFVVGRGSCADDVIGMVVAPTGGSVIENAAPPVEADRPSVHHRFHFPTQSWIDPRDLAALSKEKRRQIEMERDLAASAAIIVYDGKRLNGDAVSADLVAKKLATTAIQMDRGIEPPVQTLVWRDADNITHGFPNLLTYRAWLEGFALALDSRGMAAFAWSWVKKAELEAATTYEQLMAIDMTS